MSETLSKINEIIVNPIILFLFAVAFLYFMYGVFQYVSNADNEGQRSKSRQTIMYGLLGLFMMVAVFAIWEVLLNTFEIDTSPITEIQK